jgi:putative transcriptional regulator
MSRTPRSKSDAFEAIHSSAEGMFRVGTIDKATMRRFDQACLTLPPPVKALDKQL